MDVERRLLWATRVEELTIERFRARWDRARAAIRRADGVVASELYRRPAIDLAPQMGLVPIGMNPRTKLWEFYHLRSAWDPSSGVDPADIPIACHGDDGAIDVADDTGMVFVLLPGGTFTMGAQSTDENGPNYDPRAVTVETPPHVVTLAPFFLARHELTQGQWARLSRGENPARYGLHWQRLFKRPLRPGPITPAHPVEEVDWRSSSDLLERYRLRLPTEAQWEYGCRAGTTTPWWTGREVESLFAEGIAENFADSHPGGAVPWTAIIEGPMEDGHALMAPVDALRPNPWGLMHMHGNVREWCRDRVGAYSEPVAAGDGERQPRGDSTVRVFRGGGFDYAASASRSSARCFLIPHVRSESLGLRAAERPSGDSRRLGIVLSRTPKPRSVRPDGPGARRVFRNG